MPLIRKYMNLVEGINENTSNKISIEEAPQPPRSWADRNWENDWDMRNSQLKNRKSQPTVTTKPEVSKPVTTTPVPVKSKEVPNKKSETSALTANEHKRVNELLDIISIHYKSAAKGDKDSYKIVYHAAAALKELIPSQKGVINQVIDFRNNDINELKLFVQRLEWALRTVV